MRKIDAIWEARRATRESADAAAKLTTLDFNHMRSSLVSAGNAVISPGSLTIEITAAITLEVLDELHAWAHDMLDEQPEVT